jgi:hypothetical protein
MTIREDSSLPMLATTEFQNFQTRYFPKRSALGHTSLTGVTLNGCETRSVTLTGEYILQIPEKQNPVFFF